MTKCKETTVHKRLLQLFTHSSAFSTSCTLRPSSDTCMLEIQQYKCKTHGFHTFSCFGPHIWNSLPQDLRHCSTLSSFKAKLKTFSSHSISILTNVAGELCKLARVTGPKFPHPFSPVRRCLPATGRCRTVRYKRQCLPSFCTMC